MSRCTFVLLLAGMVALCMSAATPAWEELGAEELALSSVAAKLKGCVKKVDSSKLKEDEKKVLQACIRPAINGCPQTEKAVADRYVACVERRSVSQTAKDVANQVAKCMTAAPTPAWEVPAAEPQDLVDDFVDTDAEELAFIGSGAKLRGCVRRVDKSKLKEDEKKVLQACIRPALVGLPFTPEAIAARYVKCVVSKNVSEVAKDVANQVAKCMMAAPTPAWEVPAAEPQDLEVDLAYVGLGGKLRECVRRVDKSKLKEEEKKVLQACVRSALLGLPYNARAIAERYAKCVQSKNVSQASLDAAKQVVNCMSMRM